MKLSEKDILGIYNKVFKDNESLLATVRIHSEQVAGKAIDIGRRFKEADLDFLYSASMLHDIGVINCFAPDIFCFGNKPYICHGPEGKKILDELNLPDHGLVCIRHTGAGITAREIINNNLPLPPIDMLPLSIEEKIICYADSFFSKSGDLKNEKKIDEVLKQMKKFGDAPLQRFIQLHQLLG